MTSSFSRREFVKSSAALAAGGFVLPGVALPAFARSVHVAHTETLRVGLVGCGKVATVHAAALKNLPEAEFVAACDASRERAEAFAARYGVRSFADVSAMLRDGGVEAVIVGTPHPLHAGPTIRAVEAGVRDVVLLVEIAARQRELPAGVVDGRYQPEYLHLEEVVARLVHAVTKREVEHDAGRRE